MLKATTKKAQMRPSFYLATAAAACVFFVLCVVASAAETDPPSNAAFRYFFAGPNGIVRACQSETSCGQMTITTYANVKPTWSSSAGGLPLPASPTAPGSILFQVGVDKADNNKKWAMSLEGIDSSTDAGTTWRKIAFFNCNASCGPTAM
eukprot:Opistho-1_new@93936